MAKRFMIKLMPDGEFVFFSTLKGSNPSGEKHPTIHYPNCGKYMYYVYDKEAKNKIACYDLADPKYKYYPRNHIRVCQKCHHRIGIMSLDSRMRKLLNLPQMHECHEKIVI